MEFNGNKEINAGFDYIVKHAGQAGVKLRGTIIETPEDGSDYTIHTFE